MQVGPLRVELSSESITLCPPDRATVSERENGPHEIGFRLSKLNHGSIPSSNDGFFRRFLDWSGSVGVPPGAGGSGRPSSGTPSRGCSGP
jgi:hypothetical protein